MTYALDGDYISIFQGCFYTNNLELKTWNKMAAGISARKM